MATTATTIQVRCNKDNYEERKASTSDIKPGHLLELLSTNKVRKHSVVGGRIMRWVAIEDEYQGQPKNQYDAYTADNPVRIQAAVPGELLALRLPAAAKAVSVGNLLISDGAGCVIKSDMIGAQILSNAIAASTAVTNTVSTEQDYDVTYSLPANTLRAGDILKICGHVVVSAAAGTDTITVKVYVGATAVLTTVALDSTTADIVWFEADVIIRTVGASGTMVCRGLSANGPAASGTAKPSILASTTIDTTAAKTIKVSSTWSATTATCTSALQSLSVELIRTNPDVGVAYALEAIDNSAGASEALIIAEML